MQEKDFTWYKENLKTLYDTYGDSFIAIKNMQVLGSYSTFADAVYKTALAEELGSFIVQKCGADESCYTNYIASMFF